MLKTKKRHFAYTHIHPTVQLAAAALLFVASIALSRGDTIPDWEVSLFLAIYTLPEVLRVPFLAVTQLGSIYFFGLLVVAYIVWRSHYHNVLRLLLTGLLAYVASGFAKDIWGRGRPFELIPDVANLDYFVRGPGFPSGHMALATALAMTLGHYLPRKYHVLIVAWIIGVGLSRMYLGVHTPVDILGGFAIGWGCYALFRHVRLYDVSFKRRSKTSANGTAIKKRANRIKEK